MEGDTSVKAGDKPLAILGAIACAIPFAISSTTQSSTSVNGHVTSFVYRDNVAIGAGAVAAVCGLLALVLAIKNKGGVLRIGAAIAVLGLGGLHVARGFGAFAKPATDETTVVDHDIAIPKPAPEPPKVKTCADAAACNTLGDELKAKKDLAAALPAYTHGCELGNGDSCFEAAVIVRDGAAGAADATKAAELFDTGCAHGQADACMNLGVAYLKGEGVPKDEAKGKGLFEKGCTGNVMRSCTNLGIVYRDGIGMPPDGAKARESFAKACDHDWGPACDKLGVELATSKAKADHAKAGPLFEKACKLDDIDGCTDLAISYEKGDAGLKKDLAKARELYAGSCDKDDPRACNNLGALFDHGRGVTEDKAKAKQLFDKACKGGLELGCDNAKGMK